MLQILALKTSETYTCGDLSDVSFGGMLPYVVSLIITIIKIAIPVLLIIFGMIDMGKAVMAQKEDEIKKGQQTLIKRVIAAIIVFFVITIVQMLLRFLARDENSITACFNCFVNGKVSDEGGNGCYPVDDESDPFRD